MVVEIITKEALTLFKKEVFDELKKILTPSGSAKPWLRSYEVKTLLSVSSGALLAMCAKDILPYSRVGASMFYKYEYVAKAIEMEKGK